MCLCTELKWVIVVVHALQLTCSHAADINALQTQYTNIDCTLFYYKVHILWFSKVIQDMYNKNIFTLTWSLLHMKVKSTSTSFTFPGTCPIS